MEILLSLEVRVVRVVFKTTKRQSVLKRIMTENKRKKITGLVYVVGVKIEDVYYFFYSFTTTSWVRGRVVDVVPESG